MLVARKAGRGYDNVLVARTAGEDTMTCWRVGQRREGNKAALSGRSGRSW